jgi:hypothetical protein
MALLALLSTVAGAAGFGHAGISAAAADVPLDSPKRCWPPD